MEHRSLPDVEMITVKEAAFRLGLSRSSVYAMVDSGQLQCRRVGPRRGKVRILVESIETHLHGPESSNAIQPRTLPRHRPRPAKVAEGLKHLRL
jgi:excisionase family DNA binding protein